MAALTWILDQTSERLNILRVEQDVSVRKSHCTILKNAGYEAALASPRVAEIVLSAESST
jgi:hypothetical protein